MQKANLPLQTLQPPPLNLILGPIPRDRLSLLTQHVERLLHIHGHEFIFFARIRREFPHHAIFLLDLVIRPNVLLFC